jgi:dihydrofolate reductase
MYCLIVAMDQNGIIGQDNTIPWHLPEDLRRFRSITLNHIVVMGRKTFESLPFKHGLPNRINVVITRDKDKYVNIPDKLYFITMSELDGLISEIKKNRRVFVIGGNKIYKELFNRCELIYFTLIYRPNSIVTNDSVIFDCNLTHDKFITIYESGNFITGCLEYEFYTYFRVFK